MGVSVVTISAFTIGTTRQMKITNYCLVSINVFI